MGQLASFTLNNAAAVAITFAPERLPDGRISWVDRRKASLSLQPRFILSQSPASGGRPTHKASIEFIYPVEGLVNNVAAPVAVGRFKDGNWIIPDIMPAADRADMQAFAANVFDVALVKNMMKDMDWVY